jgi:hypothetical protein
MLAKDLGRAVRGTIVDDDNFDLRLRDRSNGRD